MAANADIDSARRPSAPAKPSPANPWIKRGVPLITLIILVLLPVFQIVNGGLNYWLHMLLYIFLYVIMSASWNIIGGYAGYISLGHNVFFAFGAYFTGMLFVFLRISPFLMAPFAGILAMAGGMLFGLIALRTRGTAFIISTIALVLLMNEVLDNWRLTGGSSGLAMSLINLEGQYAKIPYYYYLLAIMVLTILVTYFIKHSKFGLGLRAISQDETKAEVIDTAALFKAFSMEHRDDFCPSLDAVAARGWAPPIPPNPAVRTVCPFRDPPKCFRAAAPKVS